MTIARNARLAGLALGLGLASQTTLAADNGFYVGVDVGQSSVDVTQEEMDELALGAVEALGYDVVDAESSLDKSDTAFGAVIGYQFSRNLAVEAGYVDLGASKYVASGLVTNGVQTIPMDIGIDLATRGPTLSAIGILPLNDRWSLDARVGALWANLSVSISAASGTTEESESVSDSSTAMIYGAGVNFAFSPVWSVRADYRRYDGISDDLNVDLISLGLRYKFQ
jgi:OOP family OmpA-OmpF porin